MPGVGAVSGVRFTEGKVAGKAKTTSVIGIDPATLRETYTLKWKDGSDATLARLGSDGILADVGYSKTAKIGDRVQHADAGRQERDVHHPRRPRRGLGLRPARRRARHPERAPDRRLRHARRRVRLPALRGGSRSGDDPRRDRHARWPRASRTSQTRDREEVKEQQAGQINQLLYLIYALLALSVIVALFGIVNTLALSIFERTRELGLLRAVGMSRRQVKRIVRLEAVITSLIGALLGLVLGVMFALAISRPLEEEGFRLTFPVGTLVLLVTGAALAGMLASLWPARRAARLDVLKALAYE